MFIRVILDYQNHSDSNPVLSIQIVIDLFYNHSFPKAYISKQLPNSMTDVPAKRARSFSLVGHAFTSNILVKLLKIGEVVKSLNRDSMFSATFTMM